MYARWSLQDETSFGIFFLNKIIAHRWPASMEDPARTNGLWQHSRRAMSVSNQSGIRRT